jgi:CheY-like chemotaxis protein
MGHELRTPLNGIIGVVNLLKNEPDAIKKDEYLKIIQTCSDDMLLLINDILDFNKIEAGKLDIQPDKINLRQLLINVSTPFIALAKEKNVELTLEIDQQADVLIFADGSLLGQILNNLFINALKLTNEGFIKLKVTCHKKDSKTLDVKFSMQDTGTGLDKADKEKIFEGFWQVYDENAKQLTGTGLGLSICIRLLKLMGGKLTLDSEKGKGSTFSFDLIFDYAIAQHGLTETPAFPEDGLLGVNILLVEDNKINMMIAKKILTDYKASVTCTYNGQEAMDNLKEGNNYNIILMDLEMPVMNGYVAIYEIKKSLPKIPVIAVTASLVDEQMLADLLASGFSDCVLKPFQPHQLLLSIQKQLKH